MSYYAGYTTSDAFGCIPRLKKRVECILSDVLKKERAKTGVEVAFGWVKERLQDSFSIWMKLSAKWDSLRPRIYLGVLSVREMFNYISRETHRGFGEEVTQSGLKLASHVSSLLEALFHPNGMKEDRRSLCESLKCLNDILLC